ncbi:MAG: proton-conducting membrane transporter [Actinomycetales bacterium]|nr:proton-conducting membrane transporter [Actinomycetales bacterium]
MSDAVPEPEQESMTIIAFSGDLDKLWPTMILSSTAAATGMNVTVFFTFWGLFPLVREDVKHIGKDKLTRAMSQFNPPGFQRAHLSKLKFGGMGNKMMRQVASNEGLLPPEELFEMCQELDVNMWPCQMTMDLMGITPDMMVPGLGEPVGAATALQRMAKSEISLFI